MLTRWTSQTLSEEIEKVKEGGLAKYGMGGGDGKWRGAGSKRGGRGGFTLAVSALPYMGVPHMDLDTRVVAHCVCLPLGRGGGIPGGLYVSVHGVDMDFDVGVLVQLGEGIHSQHHRIEDAGHLIVLQVCSLSVSFAVALSEGFGPRL